MKRSGIFSSTQKPTVLVVDPDAEWQSALAGMLEGSFCVMTASSFDIACEILADVEIDAIVSEAVLGGKTGADLSARVADAAPELADSVIFVTGGGFDARLADFFAATAAPVLYKSLDGSALRHAVRGIASVAAATPPARALAVRALAG